MLPGMFSTWARVQEVAIVNADDERSGNGPLPGTCRKTVPIVRASGPAEYTAGQQELPLRLKSLAEMVQWAQN
jgi:NADH-quinone oxidoreductase subunit B